MESSSVDLVLILEYHQLFLHILLVDNPFNITCMILLLHFDILSVKVGISFCHCLVFSSTMLKNLGS